MINFEGSTQTSKLPYDHPIEKAKIILSSAYYDDYNYNKTDLLNTIGKALDYIQEWESKQNER